jgi:mono/diheme cytochrome c family protein
MRLVGLVVYWLAVGCGRDAAPPSDHDAGPSGPPTYYKDVAAILGENCVGCHHVDGAGPFPLATYADAADTADAVAAMTASRQMPPWPADGSGECNTFVGQRWLTDEEIATLSEWAAAGAPAGDPSDERPIEVPPVPSLNPTVELGSPEPYVVAPGLQSDEYRCFIVDPGLATDRYITAFAVLLDRADVVHHMQLYSADTELVEAEIVARDAEDEAPGYPCVTQDARAGLRYIGVWAAGDTIKRWPQGTGIHLRANRKLVVQFHYHNHSSAPILDRSKVALELADSVASEGTITGLGMRRLALAPGMPNVESSSAEAVSDTMIAHAARIHMHRLGTHARFELLRGTETKCLLDIPRWAFGWQLFYTYDEPIEIREGDLIKVTCGYDTTSRTEVVEWGESTDDEMCIGYLYVTQ